MVVNTAEEHTTEPVQPSAAGVGTAYGSRILRAFLDVIELEAQIITLKLLAAMRDAAVRACLVAAGIMLAAAGLVFMEIAVFQTIERLIPTVWVFFVFAVTHLVLAGGAVYLASRPMKSGHSGIADRSNPSDKIGGS